MTDAPGESSGSGRPVLVTAGYYVRIAGAHRGLQLRTAEGRAFLVVALLLIVVGILLLALGSAFGALVILLPVVLLAQRFVAAPLAIARGLRKQLPVGSVVTAGLSPDGLWTTSAAGAARLAWRQLRDIRRIGDVVLLRLAVGSWYALPGEALPADAEHVIRRWLTSPGPHPSPPVGPVESDASGSCVLTAAQRRSVIRRVVLAWLVSPVVLPVVVAPLAVLALGMLLLPTAPDVGAILFLVGAALLVLLPPTALVSGARAVGRILPDGGRFSFAVRDEALRLDYPGWSVDVPWVTLRAIRQSGPVLRVLRRGAPGFFWLPSAALSDPLVAELDRRIRAEVP